MAHLPLMSGTLASRRYLPTLNGFNDFVALIASKAESSGVGIDFHRPSQGLLRSRRHRVRFVQNDDLVSTNRQRHLFLSESLDLVSNDVDTSFVGRVELQDAFFVVVP